MDPAQLALQLLFALAATFGGLEPSRVIPACEEDQVIVGFGDIAAGYWTRYECVAVDEIVKDVNANQSP